MTGKLKRILVPLVIIVLCAGIVTASVLLLGKSEGKHIVIDGGGVELVRGELDLSLKRESLETLTIGSNGLPVKGNDTALTDFSKSNDNIFGIDENILIGPGCYFTAQMTVENGKPYPFEYWLEITPENGGSLLADQLELTVELGREIFIRRTLQSGLVTKTFPKVEAGQTGRFTVTLKYLDVHGNDETKNLTLAFDMVVHAKLAES